MKHRSCKPSTAFCVSIALSSLFVSSFPGQSSSSNVDWLTSQAPVGQSGGSIVVSLRSEPKTLNPVTSVDISSREVIAQMAADLIHINRSSQKTQPALAKSWKVSRDGRQYTATRPPVFRWLPPHGG